MFESLLKNSRWTLVGSCIVLAIVVYRYAINITISEWREESRLSEMLDSNKALSIQPDYLERRSNNLEGLIKKMSFDSISFRSELSGYTGLLANEENVTVISVSGMPLRLSSGVVLAQQIVFRGTFHSLLKIYYKLERERRFGIVRSAAWHLPENRQEHQASDLELKVIFTAIKGKSGALSR